MNQPPARPSVAFYYPGHLWLRGEWIKNLLLFFDGVALLVPEYKRYEPEILDPEMAGPLKDKGLLHVLEAESLVDLATTEALIPAMLGLIESGAFDTLREQDVGFHEISMSRMGYFGSVGLADSLFQELKQRGLAKDTEDGASIPLHPAVRYFILVLLAQILRSKEATLGLDLSPATDRPELVQTLTNILAVPTLPSAGHVVSSDLLTVAADLSLVPLDDVLGFREQHADEFKVYARSVRAFVRELGALAASDRAEALADRTDELKDLAGDLRTRSWLAWKKPASFALGIGGAAWAAGAGDPVGALLTAAGAAIGALPDRPAEASAFSYLFSARSELY